MTIPLGESASAVFVNNGTQTVATITLGPQRMGESWSVTSASISTTSVAQSTCRMYRDVISPSTFIDGTSTANLNVTNVRTLLNTLEKLVFVFTSGDAGSTANVVLNGTKSNSRTGV